MALQRMKIPNLMSMKRIWIYPIPCLLKQFHYSYSEEKISEKIVIRKPLENPDNRVPPVAVILGWAGSKHHHLRKYAQLLERKGYITLMVTHTLADVTFLQHTRAKQLSVDILHTIGKHCTKEAMTTSLLFYPFSGGYVVYNFICNALDCNNDKFGKGYKVIGTIFDSSPTPQGRKSIPAAQKSAVDQIKNQLLKYIVWYLIGIAAPLALWYSPTAKLLMKQLEDSPIKAPQLFLYSKADNIFPYQHIQHFADHRRKLGIKVEEKVWEDTKHVSHYKEHPAEYERVINKFIQNLDQ